jgi:hypothetical protein
MKSTPKGRGCGGTLPGNVFKVAHPGHQWKEGRIWFDEEKKQYSF